MSKPTFDFTDRPYIKAHAERTRAEIDRANNPHEFRVEAIQGGHYIIVNERGNDIGARLYSSFDDASDAIGEMIADQEADHCRECGRPLNTPCESCAYQRYRDGRA